MMEYSIKFKNHIKALEFSLIAAAMIVIFALYQSMVNNLDYRLKNALLTGVLISFLPVLYLHLEYYIYNKGTKLAINVHEKRVSHLKGNNFFESFNFDEIDKITLYMPPSWYRSSTLRLLPFEQYHYARIYTKNKREVIVTCLMAKNVGDVVGTIRGVTIEKKKRLFASILLR